MTIAAVLLRIFGALVVIAVAIFANLPNDNAFWRTLQDFCHFPAFVAVSISLISIPLTSIWPARLLGPGRGWVPYLAVFAICMVAGVGIELAQSLIGGDVSAGDVFTDFLGTSAGLGAYALVTRTPLRVATHARRVSLAAIAGAALLTALAPIAWMLGAYAHRDMIFPALVKFESPIDLFFLDARKSDWELLALPSSIAKHSGERGMKVTLRGDRTRPGIFFDEVVPDWTRYETLSIDLANAGDKDVKLRMRVHDTLHVVHLQAYLNDRYNTTIDLAPHSRQIVRIPLKDIRLAPAKREMNMREIVGIGIFNPRLTEDDVFYISGIWLE